MSYSIRSGDNGEELIRLFGSLTVFFFLPQTSRPTSINWPCGRTPSATETNFSQFFRNTKIKTNTNAFLSISNHWSHRRTPSAKANYNFLQYLRFFTQPGERSSICISSVTCCQRTQMTKGKLCNCFPSLCSWLYSPPPLYSCCFSSFATFAQAIVKRQAKKPRPTSVKNFPWLNFCLVTSDILSL